MKLLVTVEQLKFNNATQDFDFTNVKTKEINLNINGEFVTDVSDILSLSDLQGFINNTNETMYIEIHKSKV